MKRKFNFSLLKINYMRYFILVYFPVVISSCSNTYLYCPSCGKSNAIGRMMPDDGK